MSLSSGTLSGRRYVPQDDNGNPDCIFPLTSSAFRECIEQHAFREPPIPTSDPVVGWVNPTNPLSTDFTDPNTWRFDTYVLLHLRVDERRINTTLAKAHVGERIRAWCEEHGLERCPASVRAEIREQVESELLRKTNPRTRIYEVLWSRRDHYVLIGALSEKVNELVGLHFRRAFDLRLVAFDPRTALSDEIDWLHDEPRLVPHFLLWLWWTTEQNGCALALNNRTMIDVWVDARISLEGGASKAVLSGENPSAWREARAALASQKLPEEIRLGIREGETEWLFTLRAAGFDVTSIRLPIPSGDDLEETVQVRMLSYEALFTLILGLWDRFIEERCDPLWTERTAAMKDWIAQGNPEEQAEADRFRERQIHFANDVQRNRAEQ